MYQTQVFCMAFILPTIPPSVLQEFPACIQTSCTYSPCPKKLAQLHQTYPIASAAKALASQALVAFLQNNPFWEETNASKAWDVEDKGLKRRSQHHNPLPHTLT